MARLTRSKKHPSKSTEDIKFPAGLGFLRDTTVIIALSMAVIYVVVALFAGSSYIESELSDGQNFIVFAILQAATFSAGVFVILAGVRVVLGEIVPAFKGISEKLVKNSKPALDVPMIFTFAPNAVLIASSPASLVVWSVWESCSGRFHHHYPGYCGSLHDRRRHRCNR